MGWPRRGAGAALAAHRHLVKRPPRGAVGAGLVFAGPVAVVVAGPWLGPLVGVAAGIGLLAVGGWLFFTSGRCG